MRPLQRGWLECWQCGRVLENRTGRSIDGALACSIATLLLLLPANFLTLMTVHIGPITTSSHLADGVAVAWAEDWPLVSIVLALEGIILPFVRFGLLSAILTAIRFGHRGRWLGRTFRYTQILDQWAMSDVLLIGAGIGYGRIASQLSVHIDAGGWCFVCVAVMTMVTRGALERREVWRRIWTPALRIGPHPIACTSCDLPLPEEAHGQRCPRCAARVHRRRPSSVTEATALILATAVLTPIAYAYPMSEFWRAGEHTSHSVIDGIEQLFRSGFWYFGVVIFIVSVIFPLTKLISMAWFLTSVHRRSSWQLRRKTKLYRFVDSVGRWSTLDPFTVMIFAPMIQFGQLAHFDFMGGAAAFLATVILSMLATHAFDPRLMWDARGMQEIPERPGIVPARA